MEFVPFTLFFMVCLTGFHGSLSMQYLCEDPAGTWPKKCENDTYCFCMPKDYPSTEQFQEILNRSDIDFPKIKQPPIDNRGADNICQHYVVKDLIYMIKDTANETRYVLQDPNIFQSQIRVEECQKYQSLGALEDQLECRQKTIPWPLVVLTPDKASAEVVFLRLPSSCSLEPLN